jgi:hypothetical protein
VDLDPPAGAIEDERAVDVGQRLVVGALAEPLDTALTRGAPAGRKRPVVGSSRVAAPISTRQSARGSPGNRRNGCQPKATGASPSTSVVVPSAPPVKRCSTRSECRNGNPGASQFSEAAIRFA